MKKLDSAPGPWKTGQRKGKLSDHFIIGPKIGDKGYVSAVLIVVTIHARVAVKRFFSYLLFAFLYPSILQSLWLLYRSHREKHRTGDGL